MGHEFVSNLRRWDIVAGLCQSIDARTYVEVGCKEGRTTGRVLEQCPDLRAIAIDPWCEQPGSGDVSRETYADWDFGKIEREFWENVGEHKDRCDQVRHLSEECAHDWSCFGFPALHGMSDPAIRYVDLVFIDALHDYESVKQDIALWWPLVREGGYLCGHDYQHRFPGVMRAVVEAFPLFKVGLAPDSVWFIRKETLQ